jgi:hypothetical protein
LEVQLADLPGANDISQQFPFEESHIFRTPVLLVEIY